MHLVLRSSRARGAWSFKRPRNEAGIKRLTERFGLRYGVRVISMANVGNHLHLHIKLSNRRGYAPFIRALTGAIAMLVSGAKRDHGIEGKFWDYRPFTRVVVSLKAFLNLRDYIAINRLEGFGYRRDEARMIIERSRAGQRGIEHCIRAGV